MNAIKISLIISVVGGAVVFVIGMITMPVSNGGEVPLNQSKEQYNQEQQAAIIQSSGFKMTLSGCGICILGICLLVLYRMKEDEEFFNKEQRRVHIAPVSLPREIIVVGSQDPTAQGVPVAMAVPKPMAMAVPKPKPVPVHMAVASPVPVTQVVFHKLMPPRTFKYPPPYDVLNKK